jgi:hypothetical protein
MPQNGKVERVRDIEVQGTENDFDAIGEAVVVFFSDRSGQGI